MMFGLPAVNAKPLGSSKDDGETLRGVRGPGTDPKEVVGVWNELDTGEWYNEGTAVAHSGGVAVPELRLSKLEGIGSSSMFSSSLKLVTVRKTSARSSRSIASRAGVDIRLNAGGPWALGKSIDCEASGSS
jgi:hypothetical protein